MVTKLAKISESAAEAQAAVAEMNPNLRREYDNLREEVEKTNKNMVKSYHAIGLIVVKIETGGAKYGSRAVALVATALGYDSGSLYKAKQFVEKYPKDQLEALMARRTVDNRPITWSHFAQLVHVDSDEKREELLERVFAEGLSVRDLKDAIDEELATTHSRRAPTAKSAIGALNGMSSRGSVFVERLVKDWRPAIVKPLESADLTIVEQTLERLDDDIRNMQRVASAASEKASDLAHLKNQLEARRQRLQAQASSEKSAKTEEPAERPRVNRTTR